jgi:hypothetical protein
MQSAVGICPEFSNYSLAIIFSFPSLVRTHLEVLANSPENSCFGFFAYAVDFWIIVMAERFLKTVSGISNALLEFDKKRINSAHLCRPLFHEQI